MLLNKFKVLNLMATNMSLNQKPLNIWPLTCGVTLRVYYCHTMQTFLPFISYFLLELYNRSVTVAIGSDVHKKERENYDDGYSVLRWFTNVKTGKFFLTSTVIMR